MSNANEEELYSIRTMSSSCPSQAINMPPKCTSSDRPSFVPSPANQHELLLTYFLYRIAPSTRLRRALHLRSLPLVRRIILSHPYDLDLLRNPDPEDLGNTSLHLAAKLGLVDIAVCLHSLKTSRTIFALFPTKTYLLQPHPFVIQQHPSAHLEPSPPPT